jgi:hypothetical protein
MSYQAEGIAMSYTMSDYRRENAKEQLQRLTPEERREALRGLPLEERLAGVSSQEILEYLKRLQSARTPRKIKPRRNK